MNTSQKKGLISLFLLLSLSLAYKWFSRPNPTEPIEIASKTESSGESAKLDLNLATQQALDSVPGIGEKLADRIIRFRELIGGYKEVRDLMGIRGMTAENLLIIEEYVQADTTTEGYRQLAAHKPNSSSHFFSAKEYHPSENRGGYAPIEDQAQKQHGFAPDLAENSSTVALPEKNTVQKVVEKLDLNLADSTDLVKIQGIGAKTASAIVRYRERLGFFRSVDQLLEIKIIFPENYSRMAESLYVDPRTMESKRIDLNTASLERLGRHPYIGWSQAKVIIAFREAHGPFQQAPALGSIRELDADLWQKMEGYFLYGG